MLFRSPCAAHAADLWIPAGKELLFGELDLVPGRVAEDDIEATGPPRSPSIRRARREHVRKHEVPVVEAVLIGELSDVVSQGPGDALGIVKGRIHNRGGDLGFILGLGSNKGGDPCVCCQPKAALICRFEQQLVAVCLLSDGFDRVTRKLINGGKVCGCLFKGRA